MTFSVPILLILSIVSAHGFPGWGFMPFHPMMMMGMYNPWAMSYYGANGWGSRIYPFGYASPVNRAYDSGNVAAPNGPKPSYFYGSFAKYGPSTAYSQYGSNTFGYGQGNIDNNKWGYGYNNGNWGFGHGNGHWGYGYGNDIWRRQEGNDKHGYGSTNWRYGYGNDKWGYGYGSDKWGHDDDKWGYDDDDDDNQWVHGFGKFEKRRHRPDWYGDAKYEPDRFNHRFHGKPSPNDKWIYDNYNFEGLWNQNDKYGRPEYGKHKHAKYHLTKMEKYREYDPYEKYSMISDYNRGVDRYGYDKNGYGFGHPIVQRRWFVH